MVYGKYKITLLIEKAQDSKNNIFQIAFALVEGETGGGCSFFHNNLRMHIALQPNHYLVSDKPSYIESA